MRLALALLAGFGAALLRGDRAELRAAGADNRDVFSNLEQAHLPITDRTDRSSRALTNSCQIWQSLFEFESKRFWPSLQNPLTSDKHLEFEHK